MADTVLSGATATVDYAAAKADVRRAVEDFLQTEVAEAATTLRSAADIAGGRSSPLPPGRSFATMRCNSSFQRLVG